MENTYPEKANMEKEKQTFIELLYDYSASNEKVLSYCYDKLNVLLKSDDTNGTEYLKTLQIYIETERSLTESARRLYIHRNTVLQRIKKIMELLQIDLHEFEVANEYYMMIRIVMYMKERM